MNPQRRTIDRAGCRLQCVDYGGDGPPVVLLHGLAGYGREWDDTAAWLTAGRRVVAPDQRGHGRSQRRPADVSRSAFVDDVVAWIAALDLGPVVLAGQSLGAHTGLLAAARHPDLIQALIVAEATPQPDPGAPAGVGAWLRRWPNPFTSREDAVAYFGGDSLWARAWADGLEERPDGLWPAFEVPVMLAALDESSRLSYWNEWEQIRCPTLVVHAAGGEGCPGLYQRMVDSLPGSRLVEIPDSGHDVHLEQPERWRTAVGAFLAALG